VAEAVQTWQLRSAAAVSISNDEVIGVLAVYSGQRNAFDEETTGFLAEVANDIALGVHTLRLDRNLHATLDHLRSSMNSTVEAIASIVELRDPYTAGHERRVRNWLAPSARKWGCRAAGRRAACHRLSARHRQDRGAGGDLEQTDQADGDRNGHGQGAFQAGYDILKNLEFPWPVAQAVLQHHERSTALVTRRNQGSDIILEARILMVADVVEAMASHRPYRASRGLELALDEISANRGRTFDEQVVDACIRLFAEKGFKFNDDASWHEEISLAVFLRLKAVFLTWPHGGMAQRQRCKTQGRSIAAAVHFHRRGDTGCGVPGRAGDQVAARC